ncbi:sigma-54 dependent transcriptional regulator [soil metagenome]
MSNILIVDDEESIAWALRKAFEREGHTVSVASTAEDGLRKAKSQQPAVAFLDVRLPGMDGLTALDELHDLSPHTKTIIITAHGNLATAVKAVEGGAFDYLAKPFDLNQALDAVKRATATTAIPNDTEAVPTTADELVGVGPAMQTVFKRIAMVSPTDAGVLITGESGTGKELVARAVHAHSLRKDKPFLPVHVAALNPNLVESELFGHAKGSFTGADRAKPGLLTLASGGTIFLDELGDIPLPVQAKLLRVLERKEVFPVGGATPVSVDVRIVSATHADLSKAVQAGTFRHDLLYRLNVYPIHVPALRDRLDDLSDLAAHFLRLFGSTSAITPETLAAMKLRTWPGNVRELRNALEHAAILARGGPILPDHLPEPMSNLNPEPVNARLAALVREWVAVTLKASTEPAELYQQLQDDVEPTLIAEVLRNLNGNRLAAAKVLGLARATLRKLMRKYDLDDGGAEEED